MGTALGAAVATFAMIAATGPAEAQTATPGPGVQDSSQNTGIDNGEQIIVTATKRSESILNVPSSVTVVGGKQLEQFNATQLSDFSGYVPGFVVTTGGIPGAARLSLRGIASNTSATVGTYIDDVPLGSSSVYGDRGSLSLDLFPYDINHVEVLRGPQGTLYGANSMGGVLKYTTTQPDTNNFSIRAGGDLFGIESAGNIGWGLRAAANVPIAADIAAVRVSYFRQHSPGFIRNIFTGEDDINVGRQQGGRLAVLLKLRPDLSLKLSAVQQNLDYDGGTAITVRYPGRQPVGDGLSRTDVLPTPYRQRLTLLNATLNWQVGGADIVSATSWSRSHTQSQGGFADLLPIFGIIGHLDTQNRLKKVTQEVRIVSPTGAAFEWLVGGFFTREDYKFRQTGDALFPDGTPAPAFSPLLDASQPSRYTEYALFGNASYHLTNRLELTGGLRWTKDKQRFGQTNTGFLFNPDDPTSVLTVSTDASEDVVNYMASAQYRFSRDSMVYARVASGYRPGGPNIAFPDTPATFKSDSLTDYEIGVKSEFLDRLARIDASLFYIDWKNMQVVLTGPSSIPYFVNSPARTVSRGAEISLLLSPTDGLQLGLNVAYTDATIRGDVPQLRARAGDHVPNVPRWTNSATLNYTLKLRDNWDATLGVGYRYLGPRRSRFTSDNRGIELGHYSVLDANVGVGNNRWTARLYAKNLFDERGFSTDGGFAGDGLRNLTIIQPRTIGVALDTRF